MATIAVAVFYDFFVFDKLYLFKGLASDSVVDTYPNYMHIRDYLRTEGFPKWSFSQGLGQNILPFSFPDPFVSILYLLDRENLAYGIFYMELAKIFLSGLLFYRFLLKLRMDEYSAIFGGVFYAFSGFIVVGSCWNLFTTEALYLIMLLYAYELLVQNGKWFWFPLVVALIAVLQPFDLWLIGSVTVGYAVCRHFSGSNASIKELSRQFMIIAALTLLGIGISSLFFLSEVRAMLNSPRGDGPAGYYNQLFTQSPFAMESELYYITLLTRFFSLELLGQSNSYQGWYNFMEAPMFYCGLFSLLVFPQFFVTASLRKRIVVTVLLGVIAVLLIFPFFRYAYWLFTGNYFRLLGFYISVFILFFSAMAIHRLITNKSELNVSLLLCTLLLLLVTLFYPYAYLKEHPVLNTDLRNQIAIYLLVYTVLLLLFRDKKNRSVVIWLLPVVFVVELVHFHSRNVAERMAVTGEEHSQRVGYFDYTNEAIGYLNSIDKSFFRVSKDYWSGPSNHASFNDAKVQRYRGTGSYHSFNHPYYVHFLAGLNLIDEKSEEQTRWITGLRYYPMLHSHLSIKYFLSKNADTLRHINYDLLGNIADVKIYKNKHYLPLGFAYESIIRSKRFTTLSQDQKIFTLYRAFVLNDSIYPEVAAQFPRFDLSDTAVAYTPTEYISDIQNLRIDTLKLIKHNSNYVQGSISLSRKKILFLSIPYSTGWSAKVDGKSVKLIRVNLGFLGVVLDKGDHIVELSFTPPMLNIGLLISCISLLVYCLGCILHIYGLKKINHASGRQKTSLGVSILSGKQKTQSLLE